MPSISMSPADGTFGNSGGQLYCEGCISFTESQICMHRWVNVTNFRKNRSFGLGKKVLVEVYSEMFVKTLHTSQLAEPMVDLGFLRIEGVFLL